MPAFDQTGPQGKGPLTGRGFGPCGCGLGRGFGLGRFLNCCRPQKIDMAEYIKSLKEELVEAEKQLKDQK